MATDLKSTDPSDELATDAFTRTEVSSSFLQVDKTNKRDKKYRYISHEVKVINLVYLILKQELDQYSLLELFINVLRVSQPS